MQIERIPYGVTQKGERVDRFTVRNSSKMNFSVITYGATITSVQSPDADGKVEELCLGFDHLESYEGKHPYFGATVGRFANRISGASFDLAGERIELDRNRGEHHIHGGSEGFSRKLWEAFPIKNEREAGVTLTLTSPGGDQGYPGTLEVRLTVMLSQENELSLSYEAKCDAPSPVNLTNHSYWNLAGQCAGPIGEHRFHINSSYYLEVDEELIPTGRILPVASTPFDFRKPKRLADVLAETGGFDHCFTLSQENALSIPAAEVYEPGSGRRVTVFTINPGLQFYTGNFLDGVETRCGKVGRHGAFCMETEEYPDSVHHETFPEVILQPNESYYRKTVYLFSADREG